MFHKREWIAGFVILIISWLTYQGYESMFFFRIPFYLKHIINFTLLAAVAAVGYYTWAKHTQKWPVLIWSISYTFIIALMGLIGVLDLFFKFEISNFREMVHNLRMFFTSPVPFGIILFLINRMKEKELKKKLEPHKQ